MRAAAYLRSRVLDSQLLEWWLVYEVHICWAVTGMLINIGVWISYLTQAPYGRTRPCTPTCTGLSLPPPLWHLNVCVLSPQVGSALMFPMPAEAALALTW